jgi:hypothetical protein
VEAEEAAEVLVDEQAVESPKVLQRMLVMPLQTLQRFDIASPPLSPSPSSLHH